MGHIKEPKGIDFVVDPTPLSAEEKKRISEMRNQGVLDSVIKIVLGFDYLPK